MNRLTASLALGSFLLIGALPAAAAQHWARPSASPLVQLAAGAEPSADRDTYAQQAQDQMREWQQKLHEFGEKAEAKGKDAGDAAERDLKEAWSRADAASKNLQSAGADGWETAKSSFQKASLELQETWHRIHPENK